MKKIIKTILLPIAVTVAIVVISLKMVLRLCPALIPLPLLNRFEESLRRPIAKKIGFQTEDDQREIKNTDGTTVKIYKPRAAIHYFDHDPGMVNTMTMDTQGFCNTARQTYETSTIDVITIGDSFTWCTTVKPEDTFTSQLSALLPRAQFYNLGQPGTGPYEYLNTFKYFGPSKHPRAVVLTIYEGNDLANADSYQKEHTPGGQPLPTATSTPAGPTPCLVPRAICPFYRGLRDGVLGEKSYSFNLALAALRLSKEYIQKQFHGPPQENIFNDFSYYLKNTGQPRLTFNRGGYDLLEVYYANKIRRGEIAFTPFDAALEEFIGLAQEYHFTPLVAYIPSADTAYGPHIKFSDSRLTEIMPYFSQTQRHYLQQKIAALGGIFIDTTSALQQAADQHMNAASLLYFPTNLHLTKEGHAIVAATLQPFLKQALARSAPLLQASKKLTPANKRGAKQIGPK